MSAEVDEGRNHAAKLYKPWQFDWKRPLWLRPARPTGPTTNDTEQSVEGWVVHHSAAALLKEEVEHILDHDVVESIENSSPVLTATLLSSSQATDPLIKSGDMILIELIEQTVMPSSSDIKDENNVEASYFGSVCRKSRRLQWPSRIQQHAAANLVACCLCRQVPNSSTAQTKDAIHMVRLLGLENSDSLESDSWKESSAVQPHEHDERPQEVASDENRLLLACLTMDGRVHLYEACELLSKSSKNNPTIGTRGDAFQSSMEALLLGRDVLAAVKETILPLCHPIRTINLSILCYKDKFSLGKGLEATVEEEDEDVRSEEEHSSNVPSSSRTSVWDPNIWDSTTDFASLPFFTKRNRPTHCLTAFDYLIVAGKGRKKRHRSNKIFPEPSSLVTPVDSRSEAAPSIMSFGTGTSRTTLDTASRRRRPENGGFVSFISLRNFLQEKTVYLPFVPRDISPFCWYDSQFLLVLGYASQDALAIHINTLHSHDSEPPFGQVRIQRIPEGVQKSTVSEISSGNAISIPRFQMIPLRLPDTQDLMPLVVGSSDLTNPPAIAFVVVDEHEGQVSVVQRTLEALDIVAIEEYGSGYDFNGIKGDENRAALFETRQHDGHVARMTLPPDVTVDSSQVWCYLGQGWCLVGVDTRRFFVCWEGASSLRGAFIEQLDNDEPQESCAFLAAVLPVRPVYLSESLQPAISKAMNQHPSATIMNLFDEAIDRVAHSNQIGDAVSQNDGVDSPTEKAEALLRQLTSWARLDQDSGFCYNSQQVVISVRFGVLPSSFAVLSLRRVVVQNGSASPFQQILEWLTIQKDFFSAASVALDLLHDTKTLRLLWRSFDKLEDDDERAKLEGLLDGIYPMPTPRKETEGCDFYQPHLSDMTVSLLIHGGPICAPTLDHFLITNTYYDAPRACMMLAAAAACAVSAEIAEDCATDMKTTMEETHFNNKMWSLRCLLQAGVSRNCLSVAIMLLDTMIPNELRHRSRPGKSVPSMALSVSIVKLILASSVDAAEVLLCLTENVTDLSYWNSLDHKMQLALSTIEIHGEYALLKQREVRCWVLHELQHSLSESAKRADIPSSWIKQVASASIMNAGCDTKVLSPPTHVPPVSSDFDLHIRHGQLIQETRKYFETDRICHSLDFAILITALLLLSIQTENQSKETPELPLQTVINAACFTAGQRVLSESHSATDYVDLLRQCTIANNIQAGANLIGGEEGLMLECCGILISECGIGMDAAEALLRTESNRTLSLSSLPSSMECFSVNHSLVHLLWMLEQHVLLIRTYGDFHVGASRNKVDPVAAARFCLRTWWCVTKNDLGRASPWLSIWLERGLEMHDGMQSPHRLACAALLRALLWLPSSSGMDEDVTLVSMLDWAPSFTVALTQSACGLFEALPPGHVDEPRLPWNGRNGEKDFAGQESTGLNESFASAVSSIRADDDW